MDSLMPRQLKRGRVLVLYLVFPLCLCDSVARSQAAAPTHPCAQCHPKEVAGYARTQMAHSLGLATRVPAGRFTHTASGTHFFIESRASGMSQELERGGVKGD